MATETGMYDINKTQHSIVMTQTCTVLAVSVCAQDLPIASYIMVIAGQQWFSGAICYYTLPTVQDIKIQYTCMS